MIENKFNYLKIGSAHFNGFLHKTIDFIIKKQLKDKELWLKFADVFGADVDTFDEGWRGEYWGKMMRGACLTYAYTNDDNLYEILLCSVNRLLEKQESDGRISSYNKNDEFKGWDMWSRKYILVGLEYFYRICQDDSLKSKIVNCLIRHTDYIISKVGEDKKSITDTSCWWGGVNSCSILDAVLQLYKITGEDRFLKFGEYIISTGGCKDGNLIVSVYDDSINPCEYPAVKAYEIMSFFEGLLTYYEITGQKHYLDVVIKFFDKLNETEQTIVGSMGFTHELFSDTTRRQTESSSEPMLETCVTVTWIRILSRLLLLTGDVRYADRIEISAYNALFGTVNFKNLPQYSKEDECIVSGLPFDSYSPLVQGYRGRLIGGYKKLPDGTHYGCCACIAAAAFALVPLNAVLCYEKGVVVNFYFDGKVDATLKSGNTVKLNFATEYPKNGEIRISVDCPINESICLKLRIPAFCKNSTVICDGKELTVRDGYVLLEGLSGFKDIILSFDMPIKETVLNGKTAFTYGPLVLTRDENKENRKIDFSLESKMLRSEGGNVLFNVLSPLDDENCRFYVKTADGEEWILSDYASCGKNWTDEFKDISVWFNLS